MAEGYTRRRFLRWMAVGAGLAATTGLAAVSGGGASGFDWRRFKGARISFMLDTHPYTTQVVPPELPKFESLTGIKVTWDVLPEDQFRQKLPLTLRSDPQSVDGYMTLPSWDGQAFSKAGWYEPLEKYVNDPNLTAPDYDLKDFFPNTLAIDTINRTLIGIPLYPEVQMLFYDRDRLQEKGVKVPETLDDFVAAAAKLNDRGSGYAGYVSRGEGIQAVYTLAPFIFAEGGRWLDEKGRPEMNSTAFIKALALYGGTLRQYGPPGVAGMTWAVEESIFMGRRAAMATDSSNFVTDFENPKSSQLAGKTGYAPLPKGPAGSHSTLISWGMAINARSRNKEAAWYFIQWLTGKPMFELMAKRKLPVARQSVWNSQVFQSSLPKAWLDTFTQELPTAAVNQANPLVVPVPQVRDAIGKAITRVIEDGPGAAASAANELQKQVLSILGMS